MSNLIEFIQNNITLEHGYLVGSIMLGVIWMVIYDLYHLLFSAVLTWFKK